MNFNEKPISDLTVFSLPLLPKNRWLCQWFFAAMPGKQ
jgi:hypothetical protein